jgi:hypothetical protein
MVLQSYRFTLGIYLVFNVWMYLGLKESNEKWMKGYFFKCSHQFINDFQTKKEKLMLDIVVSTKK